MENNEKKLTFQYCINEYGKDPGYEELKEHFIIILKCNKLYGKKRAEEYKQSLGYLQEELKKQSQSIGEGALEISNLKKTAQETNSSIIVLENKIGKTKLNLDLLKEAVTVAMKEELVDDVDTSENSENQQTEIGSNSSSTNVAEEAKSNTNSYFSSIGFTTKKGYLAFKEGIVLNDPTHEQTSKVLLENRNGLDYVNVFSFVLEDGQIQRSSAPVEDENLFNEIKGNICLVNPYNKTYAIYDLSNGNSQGGLITANSESFVAGVKDSAGNCLVMIQCPVAVNKGIGICLLGEGGIDSAKLLDLSLFD